MKKITFIFLLFAVNLAYSQWRQTTIPYSYTGKSLTISNPSFPTADIGYIITSVVVDGYYTYNYARLYKTTNKGISWDPIYNIPSGNFQSVISLSFINSNTGYYTKFAMAEEPPFTINIYKTVDGGYNWNSTGQITNISHPLPDTLDNIPSYNCLKFIDETTGYLTEWTNVYKTTSGGNSWFLIKDFSSAKFHVIDIATSIDKNTLYFGGWYEASALNVNSLLYKSSDGGSNFIAIANGYDYDSVEAITSISLAEEGNNKYLFCAGRNGVGKTENDGDLIRISYPYLLSWFDEKYISFTNVNTGVIFSDNRFRRSTNAGINWTDEYNIGDHSIEGITNIGDVVFATGERFATSQQSTYIYTRKIPIHGQYAFDLIPNPSYSGAMSVNDLIGGGILEIPGSLEVYGGTLIVSTDRVLENGNKIFYRWQGSMNVGYPYIDRTEDYITANFKTKLKSTVSDAISPVSQTKAIKDTNGVINLLYSSMGGIFYTRSTDNGATFGTEEIVNYHPTEFSGLDNYNPCLAEIKPFTLHYQPIYGQTNMAAVWERKEGSTIKIRFSERKVQNSPPLNWTEPIDLITITSVPENFKSNPRLFMVKNDGYYDSIVAVLYLKPVDGVNQLWLYGKCHGSNIYNGCIINGNHISSFSATSIMQNYMSNSLNLHIAYVQDGHIKYSHGLLEANYQYGANFSWVSPSENYTISNLDYLSNRGEPDIALRNSSNNPNNPNINMQPVVTFKGQNTVIIKIDNGDGNPTQQNLTYYPIVIRERHQSTTGGLYWSSQNIQFNSSTIQQSPNIEGSKLRNSFILNYKQGASLFWQKVVRWNGYTNSGFFCEPAYFSGTDAKIVRGALVNEYSTGQNLLALSNSSSPYQLSREPFNITNIPSTPDGTFDEVRGTVINGNVKYSFNLGSIMVNSQMINFDDDIDTTIGDGEELNEQLISKPFLLNDNDTLVTGRNASYLDEGGEFTEVQYAVYLSYNSTGQKFLELARDTVHAGDSIQVEYLEGFIIQNIPLGSDSFYVQMEIDTVWSGGGDGFGMNNISNDEGGEGDNMAMKRYIFWKNVNVITNNIPTEFNLYQNFPNPFNPLTKIKYDLPKNINVTIKVYDLIGREVAILVNNEFKTAGRYEINWNATNFASGVYIYRIQAGDYVSTKKMVLVK